MREERGREGRRDSSDDIRAPPKCIYTSTSARCWVLAAKLTWTSEELCVSRGVVRGVEVCESLKFARHCVQEVLW